MQRDTRQAEERVAGIDGLGHAVHGPQRRPMATLAVAVLDVVVHEAEVVPELDGSSARERVAVVAGDRRVREEAQERSDALAAVPTLPVEREMVADHLVQPVGGRVAVADEPDDLAFGVGDELREVEIRRGRRHRGQCTPKHVPR